MGVRCVWSLSVSLPRCRSSSSLPRMIWPPGRQLWPWMSVSSSSSRSTTAISSPASSHRSASASGSGRQTVLLLLSSPLRPPRWRDSHTCFLIDCSSSLWHNPPSYEEQMKIAAVRGFRDVLPAESAVWQVLETQARRSFAAYGFAEIILPVVEKAELFTRAIGETTDIVEKEMYTFADRDASSLTLLPEGTSSVSRDYIEHSLSHQEPVSRLFYIGPMFRRERPQKGRYRQFHQIGAEILGRDDPLIDA